MANEIVGANEIKLAFTKLQASVYFDNYDLILRSKIASYKNRLNANVLNFIKEFKKDNPFESLFQTKMKLAFFPKKLEEKNSRFSQNYYSNISSVSGNEILKPNIHCDFPIDFHLIAVIWLIRYGSFLEKTISNDSFGNRLILNDAKEEIEGGRALFKPYFRQFQNWWSLAIKKTKETLKKEENVTIINFDLQSFYHEVNFNFDKLENTLIKKFPEIKQDKIHSALKKIHIKYRDLLKKIKSNIPLAENIVPLPIGLFTSHVFANYHLKALDKFIKKECSPLYYGRYVDDVLIVVRNTVLEIEEIENGTKSSNPDETIRLYLQKYFSKLFYIPKNSAPIRFRIASLKDLQLNMDKLFIYQFDQKYTPNLIDKFVEEQKERSSMFKFLSDEEDDSFDDFESQTFESNFDNIDVNKARFKNLEDNKYKISTFLSKLIKRRIQRGSGYKEDEIGKIQRYFKGRYLIKHYYFWEKLFTILVVFKRKNELGDLVENLFAEIDLITISSFASKDFDVTADNYKSSLKLHLRYSLSMAIGLDIEMLTNNPILINFLNQNLGGTKKEIPKRFNNLQEYLKDYYLVFKKAGLLRGTFIYYPLLQFTKFGISHTVDLTSPDSIFQLSTFVTDTKGNPFKIIKIDFIPFRVKYWQTALLMYYQNLVICKAKSDSLWQTDQFSSNEIINEAFELFYEINNPLIKKEDLKSEYFKAFKTDKKDADETIIPKERSNNYYIHELNIPGGGDTKDIYRVSIINKYVDSADFFASLDGKTAKDPLKLESFDRILDEVSMIDQCDMFIMPELALPHNLITKYTDQSARKQIAFVTGIEHLNVQNIGFNFLLTVLPINIYGDKDAIPILRLKNHYAPVEEECIWNETARGRKMVVPKPYPYRYDLFEWRGFYFSVYYCYELADVFHRSIFFSQVDAIIAPVWNQDTHYYNSIIDAATRDMHNYFIIVNTSQYGFSKVSRPQDHVNKEKVIVKGGTEKGYDFTILVADLKIKELRDFQKLSYKDQKADKKPKFKPTPPDFTKNNVQKREDNETFYF